ncbi:MAG: DUF438 domain-containing protein [Vagococcus sp.]|uniref:DUF438 domain-containing protein n=1 Tax=Vagococcus sp. TaxID=1933889 RepID=UPI002FC933F2
MSEKRALERQKKLIEILGLLHEGGQFEEAKAMFDESFSDIDVSEITSAERELIAGGLDPQEIQKLCTVHAAVFKGSIKDIHHSNYEHETPGHPVHTLKLENIVIRSLLKDELLPLFEKIVKGDLSLQNRLVSVLKDLYQIDTHYQRKEMLFFSYMEQYGITAPPQVMWGVDDDIREQIKKLIKEFSSPTFIINQLREPLMAMIDDIEEMIFKEEEIMVPMVLEVFSLEDWEEIAKNSMDIGFSFIPTPVNYKASEEAKKKSVENEPLRQIAIQESIKFSELQKQTISDKPTLPEDGLIELPTGNLNLKELKAMFEVLPVDLTIVDAEDKVRFYSEGPNRVFPRTTSVIGREVVNCHPPKSMHMVEQILKDFKSGEKNDAEFWINLGERRVYIRYFALRDESKNYLGCLEVTQDITKIQNLEGQKRLLD